MSIIEFIDRQVQSMQKWSSSQSSRDIAETIVDRLVEEIRKLDAEFKDGAPISAFKIVIDKLLIERNR